MATKKGTSLLLANLVTFCITGSAWTTPLDAQQSNQIPVAAPIDSDSAGQTGAVAISSVVRIICQQQNSAGTGFLHKSGNILTAAHVVSNCATPIVVLANGEVLQAKMVASDDVTDVAIIKPEGLSPMPAALPLAGDVGLKIGTQVSFWGFPGGYPGLAPLLSVGYLSGAVSFDRSPGNSVTEWVVNAAFNSGNSGGPLIQIGTGSVIGIVSSKLAPISRQTQEIMNTLQAQANGLQYPGIDASGNYVNFSEAQLVASVMNDLRKQVQLVVGYAVTLDDVKRFLIANQIEP